jgi:hypothetical protein
MSENAPLDLETPRGLGGLLSTTLSLFGRHSGLFLSVTLLIVAPVTILVDGVWDRGLVSGPHGVRAGVAAAFVRMAVTFVAPVLVTALHVVIVRQLGEGAAPGVAAALRSAAPRFLAAVGAVFLYTVTAVVGLVFFVLPGIWLLVRGYFAAQAAVMEGMGPSLAFRRSAELVNGRWWWTAGALLAVHVLLGLVFAPAGIAVRAVHSGVAYISLLTLVQALDLSLSALFGTLLYFSLRARETERQRSLVAA